MKETICIGNMTAQLGEKAAFIINEMGNEMNTGEFLWQSLSRVKMTHQLHYVNNSIIINLENIT